MKADIDRIIPKGWRQVKRGKVRVGDRILTMYHGDAKWTKVEPIEIESAAAWGDIGLRATAWGVVIREAK